MVLCRMYRHGGLGFAADQPPAFRGLETRKQTRATTEREEGDRYRYEQEEHVLNY